MEMITAEEARKTSREVRKNKGTIIEARQIVKEHILMAVKMGYIEAGLFDCHKLNNEIWQELKDLGYTVTKKDLPYNDNYIVIGWGE